MFKLLIIKKSPFSIKIPECLLIFLFIFLGLFGSAKNSFAAGRFIDKNAPCTRGETCNGLSWSTAWKNFDDVIWSGGNTYFISGGNEGTTYTQGVDGSLTPGNGSAGDVVNIKIGQESGHNGMVTLDCSGGTNGAAVGFWGSYINVDGSVNGQTKLESRNCPRLGGMCFGGPCSHQTIKYANWSGTGLEDSEPITCQGCGAGTEFGFLRITDVPPASDHIVNLKDTGGWTGQYDLISVHDSYFESPHGIDLYGWGPDFIQCTHDCTVYNNTFIGVNNSWIDDYCSKNGCQHQDIIEGGDYQKFYNNTAKNVAAGFSNGGGDHIRVYNNVFLSGGHAIAFASASPAVTDILVANNTIIDYNNWYCFGFGNTELTSISGVYVENNLCYNSGDSGHEAIRITMTGDGSGGPLDYNIVYPGNSGSSLITAIGVTQGSHIYTSQPLLVNYIQGNTESDVHLAADDTSARGKGFNLSSLCAALNEMPLCLDKEGHSRPSSGPWDIGAYDYVSADTTPPAAPSGLAVN